MAAVPVLGRVTSQYYGGMGGLDLIKLLPPNRHACPKSGKAAHVRYLGAPLTCAAAAAAFGQGVLGTRSYIEHIQAVAYPSLLLLRLFLSAFSLS